MTRDPQLKAVLEQMAASPRPKIWTLEPPAVREQYRLMAQIFDAREVPIGKTETRMIAGAAGDIAARIYTPVAAGARAMPAIIFFHGGGWVIGDLDSHDTVCRSLAAASGCRVIAVDYRLAPEHPFPAAVEDAFAAVRSIEANAAELGVDPNRIAVAGDSAGGNLAAVVCQLARGQTAPRIAFQLLIYPVTQFGEVTASRRRFADDIVLNKDTMDWFERHYAGSLVVADDPRASPLRAKDLSGLPPAYVLTAGLDPLLDEGRQYADRLRAAGVPVEAVTYDEMVHGFVNMSGLLDTARVALEQAGLAVKAALG